MKFITFFVSSNVIDFLGPLVACVDCACFSFFDNVKWQWKMSLIDHRRHVSAKSRSLSRKIGMLDMHHL